jgi:hypothetical protein
MLPQSYGGPSAFPHSGGQFDGSKNPTAVDFLNLCAKAKARPRTFACPSVASTRSIYPNKRTFE